jgi:hypothetical protein
MLSSGFGAKIRRVTFFSRHKNTEKGDFYAALFPSLGAHASLEKSPLIFPGNHNNVNDLSRLISITQKAGQNEYQK